jgi:biopolymer transport protein ExbB
VAVPAKPPAVETADAVPSRQLEEAQRKSRELLEQGKAQQQAAAKPAEPAIPPINLLEMAIHGGPLMIPIALFSVLVVALAVERWLGLRRRRVMPRRLIAALRSEIKQNDGLDARNVYQLCQKYPSALANVLRAMLVKLGRPQAEIEQAVSEAANREASRLGGGVRWLNLAAAVAPMLGLLGTVQGMILAFYQTAHMPAGANRAQVLAESIYVALVTTFAGLSVAIPAAILAHLFGGRILKLFREMDETLILVLAQLERFDRRRRETDGAPGKAGDGSKSLPPDELRRRAASRPKS